MKKLAFCLFLVSCQTVQFNFTEVIPKDISTYFAKVENKDGGGTLAISTPSQSNKVSVDYIIESKNSAQIELSDPLGRTLASLRINGESHEYKGITFTKNKLLIDKDGFIFIGDNNSGLKLSELAALLEYKLPLSWLDLPRHISRLENSTSLLLRDNERQIEIHFINETNSIHKKFWQASIKRSFAFGLFEHRLEFKMNLVEQFLTFEHEDQIKIVWRRM